MSKEREGTATMTKGQDAVATPNLEIETYPGQIEWYRFADGNGRLYRLGLIELTDLAGQRFLGGADSRYRLAVLLDVNGIGHAYPFKMGNNGEADDYLAPEYVHEKLGKALYFRQDVLNFTQALARLLNRPTTSRSREEAAR